MKDYSVPIGQQGFESPAIGTNSGAHKMSLRDFLIHFFGADSLLASIFHPVVDEIYAYEKQHGKEQLNIALQAGLAAYNKSRTAGDKVGLSIIDGVSAFFESEAADIKRISTQAATAALAGLVKA